MYIILSYFNQINGPEILYTTQPASVEQIKKQILALIDLHQDEGFFEYIYCQGEVDIITGNYLFEINSDWSRGRKELIMLSLVLDPVQNPRNYNSVIQEFVEKIQKTPKIYKALYLNSKYSDPEIMQKYTELELILTDLQTECENAVVKVKLGQIFILGTMAVGKSSLVNQIMNQVFDPNIKPTLGIQLARMVFENYILNVVDVGGQVKLRDLWQKIPLTPAGLVFVIDCNATDPETQEAKTFFVNIMERFQPIIQENPTFPILIIANKIDLNPTFTTDKVKEILNPDRFGHKYRLALTSAKLGTGIRNAFRIIVKNLIDQNI
jgi:small GTP-binding protein